MTIHIKSYEREEEEILADFDAGLITKREKDQAIKELWQDYRDNIRAETERSLRDLEEEW